MRKAFAFAIIISFIFCVPLTGKAASWAAAEGAQLSFDQALSIAEKQHEIARLLIKEGRFDRVLPEMRKILDLNLQGEHEQLVAKSASFIAYLLAENKQSGIGHQLLDETIAKMRMSENIASLLKIKAYLYKSEGKLGLAIETLERAVEIERQKTQP
jgi:tetratricopeptide (TPR) repeat protein